MLAILDRTVIRCPFLLAILLIEIIAITGRYEAHNLFFSISTNAAGPSGISAFLFHFSKQYWQSALWVFSACLLILTPHCKIILVEFEQHTHKHPWPVWLMRQALMYGAFATITALIFEKPVDPARLTTTWFSIWFGLAVATLALWLLALAPSSFWLYLGKKKRTELLFGILLGSSAWMVNRMLSQYEAPLLAQDELWLILSGLTLRVAYSVLGFIYPNLIYQPKGLILGTPSFPVTITSVCSGIEGITLIVLFLTIYLWLFRKGLRFPQILWLFPLGILAVWLANVVRIVLLIVIGSSFSPDVAMQGFHAHAGWISFTLISLAAISLSHRMRFFSANKPRHVATSASYTLASALIVPFVLQMSALMITSALSSRFDWLYPARIGVIGGVLFYYRHAYSKLFSGWNWQAPSIGIVVFIIWMLLEPNDQGNGTGLLQSLEKLSSGWAVVWLVSRVFGSVIVVPFAEELAFRGYLIRKLIAKDFENVPSGHFSWLSLILSSLLFGLLHDRWLAGTLAGMGYAFALYRRGQLGDAVIAHVTTNALIAITVLTLGRWELWD